MTDQKLLLHEALEQDQGQPLSTSEVVALLVLAISVGVWGLLAATTAWLYSQHGWTWGVVAAGGFVAASGLALVVGAVRAIEGRRAWREARSYTPSPSPDPGPEPHPPILVRSGNRAGYLERDEPLALAAPKRKLELTPGVLEVILREIIEGHDGRWSRKRLMGIRVDGQKVSRKLYEQLTTILSRAGVLGERSQGGFEFPHHVKTLTDLEPYFPGLPLTGTAGRPAGGPERAGLQETHQAGGEVGPAERARKRWLLQQQEGVGDGS